MSIDALNEAVASSGGTWVKLRNTDDPAVEGTIVSFESRDKRNPDGDIVASRKTGKPRTEWVFTLQTADRDGEDDDGIRKLSCNESMQRAIRDAIKASGKQAEEGGTLKIGVKANPEDSYSQADYQARYTPPAAKVDLPDEDF